MKKVQIFKVRKCPCSARVFSGLMELFDRDNLALWGTGQGRSAFRSGVLFTNYRAYMASGHDRFPDIVCCASEAGGY